MLTLCLEKENGREEKQIEPTWLSIGKHSNGEGRSRTNAKLNLMPNAKKRRRIFQFKN